MVGWATQNGGTTGGKNGDIITVSNGADLAQALKDKMDSTTPLTIMVSGTITEANSGGINKIDVKDVSDVSIIGAGSGAEFNGIGIKVWRASNIVLRNLRIHHVLIGDKDCISIEGPSDHVWVDHCELYNEYDGVDKDYYDGLLDAKNDAEYITYSWNYLHDSWKASLVGYTETDTYDRKLTMHHNYYRNCNSRMPLFRGGNGHVFNNLYEQIHSTGINSRVGACIKIENNYFDTAHNPWVSAYSDVLGGAELVCNTTVNSVFDTSGSDTFEVLSCTGNVPYDYSAVLNETQYVPAIVRDNAGVGKLSDPAYF
jgi:pectate lyase